VQWHDRVISNLVCLFGPPEFRCVLRGCYRFCLWQIAAVELLTESLPKAKASKSQIQFWVWKYLNFIDGERADDRCSQSRVFYFGHLTEFRLRCFGSDTVLPLAKGFGSQLCVMNPAIRQASKSRIHSGFGTYFEFL